MKFTRFIYDALSYSYLNFSGKINLDLSSKWGKASLNAAFSKVIPIIPLTKQYKIEFSESFDENFSVMWV